MNRVTDGEIWIESEAPLANTPQWSIPLRLVRAVAKGETANLGSISPLLASNVETIRDIYAAWIVGGHRSPLNFEISPTVDAPASGVSLFFSGGVDSFYSLIKHMDEIDNLILVHGFDIPLADTKAFALAEAQVRDVASLYRKRLIIVRTNLHFEQPDIPCSWGMYHGAALAAVAYALAPCHGKVYIASSYSYADLHPWGSSPLLDPLWSIETVRFVHDGCETRINKLRTLAHFPEAVSRLRVCWEYVDKFNCGHCEKCVRTMLALHALGVDYRTAFPDALTPELVRGQEVRPNCVHMWRELSLPSLESPLYAAVQSAIHNCEAGLPPRTGKWGREVKRCLYAIRNSGRALIAPIDHY